MVRPDSSAVLRARARRSEPWQAPTSLGVLTRQAAVRYVGGDTMRTYGLGAFHPCG